MNPSLTLAGLLALCVLTTGGHLGAAEVPVADAGQLRSAAAAARPGDVLVMKDGTWTDVDLVFPAKGSKEAPITLRAATPGAVVISGNSSLRIAGSHLTVDGLWFKDAFPTKNDVVSFRLDAKNLASHCRLTHCVVTESEGVGDGRERKWVSLYGRNHAVDHCHFVGKTGKGTLMVVWLDGATASHVIEANYFGKRVKLGKNGGEILRVGDSDTSMQNARCRVVGNLFEECSGEVEVISNKSCENLYDGNVFRNCQGTLTLRHGDRCYVEGNAFFGNGRAHTGGIRIIGEAHQVIGNYLEKLEGTEARAAICLMNGIENSPANGYFQVKDALVKGNYINQCRESINIGYADKDVKAAMQPQSSVLADNVIYSENRIVTLQGTGAGVRWSSGKVGGAELGYAGPVVPVQAQEVSYEAWLKATGRKPLDEGSVGASWMKRIPSS
ncbi:polysaccharide lyase 6 family protein [Verrucomicrobium sp. BvORR106]|uniref:polysaccharide lyase 6 family protein n=1 Tax=Verrucomicrobium sp. BvORR106 TaxID=1403819 RepID=UPI000690A9E4|nr:polysaccharide lyase 6 family protein [Verrucomicrobium sp. BvORR106]